MQPILAEISHGVGDNLIQPPIHNKYHSLVSILNYDIYYGLEGAGDVNFKLRHLLWIGGSRRTQCHVILCQDEV